MEGEALPRQGKFQYERQVPIRKERNLQVEGKVPTQNDRPQHESANFNTKGQIITRKAGLNRKGKVSTFENRF